jgi:hypothetical protein
LGSLRRDECLQTKPLNNRADGALWPPEPFAESHPFRSAPLSALPDRHPEEIVRYADVTESLAGNADVAVGFKLRSKQLRPQEHFHPPTLARHPILGRQRRTRIERADRSIDCTVMTPRGLSRRSASATSLLKRLEPALGLHTSTQCAKGLVSGFTPQYSRAIL